jgi:hypothetical protein
MACAERIQMERLQQKSTAKRITAVSEKMPPYLGNYGSFRSGFYWSVMNIGTLVL